MFANDFAHVVFVGNKGITCGLSLADNGLINIMQNAKRSLGKSP